MSNPCPNPVPEQEPEPECITVPIPLRQKWRFLRSQFHNTGEEPKKSTIGDGRVHLPGREWWRASPPCHRWIWFLPLYPRSCLAATCTQQILSPSVFFTNPDLVSDVFFTPAFGSGFRIRKRFFSGSRISDPGSPTYISEDLVTI
jgi:hypothetical protein